MVNVSDCGVIADGTTLNTGALQRAIDTCSAEGGAVLHFPAGRYLTGSLQLKSDVFLRLDADAVLLGSTQAADYRNLDPFIDGTGAQLGYALIAAVDAHHVGLEGPGAIDGQGAAVRSAQKPYAIRPFLVRWVRCSDVAVRKIELRNSGAWTTHFFQSREGVFDRVKIRSRGLANNDGIDVDSSENVHISGCDISTGDDAICLKTTSLQPCRDIRVEGCTLSSDCAAFKIGTESLGDFETISVSDCRIHDTRLGGVKLLSVDGAHLRGVEISHLTLENVKVPIMLRLGGRLKTFRSGDRAKSVGALSDVVIRDIRATGAQQIGVLISGIPDHPLEAITLRDIHLQLAADPAAKSSVVELPENEAAYPEIRMFGPTMPAYGIYARHVRGLTLDRVDLSVDAPDPRPRAVLVDVKLSQQSDTTTP